MKFFRILCVFLAVASMCVFTGCGEASQAEYEKAVDAAFNDFEKEVDKIAEETSKEVDQAVDQAVEDAMKDMNF